MTSFPYQELFYNLVTSKSDNATFNKEYAEKQKMVVPHISYHDSVASKLSIIDKLQKMVESLRIEERKTLKVLRLAKVTRHTVGAGGIVPEAFGGTEPNA